MQRGLPHFYKQVSFLFLESTYEVARAGMAGVLLQLQRFTVATLSFLILTLTFNPSLFSSGAHPFHASDTISADRSLSGNQTIVSKGSKFELGFFTPGNSRYYVGIWYKNIPVQTVIWVANREAYLSNTAGFSELKLSQDGNLILVNPSNKIPVWSSNITSRKPGSTVAVLLDTGNLVLKGESHGSPNQLLWQSFDHPTDTVIPDMFWGMNKLTGEYSQFITAWKNSQDPAPGIFSHRMKPDGSNCFINVWNGSVVYDETGEWTGDAFALIPQMTLNRNFKFRLVETRERKYMTCTPCNRSTPVRMVMHFTGQMKVLIWLDDFQKWLLIFTKPSAQCDVYSICGAFGVCDQMRSTPCSCLPGFEPKFPGDWDLGDWSGGCARRSPLQCEEYVSSSVSRRRAPDVFSVISDVKLPTGPRIKLPAATEEECKVACSHDCGCSAYAYDGSTCLTWLGQLHNLQQLSWGADGHGGALIHLRLAASEQQQQQHSRTRESKILISVLTIVGSFLAVLILSSITLFTMKWRSSSDVGEATLEGNHSLFHFKYSELQKITKKFSTLLGRGGFGSVFAGMLPDSVPVAVKRLQGLRQGEKQFRAEVMTLGKVQHANLVRLRGFCAEGDKRLLVYDYMPGGSLDSHLFNVGTETPCMDWRTRFQVALGTAGGLAYLHEQCRERIIHCDIKPENILLDESYRPKVADFGMAKLVARDLSRVLTTMRGTIGYLAPEWITGLPITPKADVYSFGMVLFELVSGRRNTEMVGDGAAAAAAEYFPLLAAVEMSHRGDVLRLLDRRLAGDADVEELTRVCMAACWCVQDEESCRPMMGEVVRILEGVVVAALPPIPRSLQYLGESGYGSLLFFSS